MIHGDAEIDAGVQRVPGIIEPGQADLTQNKHASGRLKDLADLENLP
jgi:hypothetical protein